MKSTWKWNLFSLMLLAIPALIAIAGLSFLFTPARQHNHCLMTYMTHLPSFIVRQHYDLNF